jgi:hypothetical protein
MIFHPFMRVGFKFFKDNNNRSYCQPFEKSCGQRLEIFPRPGAACGPTIG